MKPKLSIDLELLSKLILVVVIFGLMVWMVISIGKFSKNNDAAQINNVRTAIDKALVQCYALEGSYPSELTHLADYGVVINHDKYYYDYGFFSVNVKPVVGVAAKDPTIN